MQIKNKLDIFTLVKGKAGIYMWINKLNGKKYIDSSVNLRGSVIKIWLT